MFFQPFGNVIQALCEQAYIETILVTPVFFKCEQIEQQGGQVVPLQRGSHPAVARAAPAAAASVREHHDASRMFRYLEHSVQRRLAEFVAFLDLLIINGVAVRWIGGGVPAVLGYLTGRSFHRGQTRAYALWIVVGTLFLAWFLIAR